MIVPLLLKSAEVVSEPPLIESESLPAIVRLCTEIVPLVMLIVWVLAVLIVTAEVDVGTPALQSAAVFQLPLAVPIQLSAARNRRSSNSSKAHVRRGGCLGAGPSAVAFAGG